MQFTSGTNPILAAYRAHCEKHRLSSDATSWLFALVAYRVFGGYKAWNAPGHAYHSLTVATPEQITHAQRVLELVEAL